MGRAKKTIPKDLVNVDEDKDHAKCLVCDKVLQFHMGNIKRHYQQLHNKDFVMLDSDKRKMVKVPLQIDKEDYLKILGKTVSQLHFRFYGDDVFQKLLQP
ncbi:hypothetical protein CVS40_11608 [Lucilia cuprina]|nr:hypothetical protein CVS40_11608 [Lucilia cuprina]